MASRSTSMLDNIAHGEGKVTDPLTPIERMILNLLLKKQAGADEAELRSSCSVAKAENVAEAPSKPSKVRAKPDVRMPPDQGFDSEDGMSEGPLDEEQLDKLMLEYGAGESEEEPSDDDDDKGFKQSESGRGRGGRGGRGTKPSRGGRGAKLNRGARRGALCEALNQEVVGDESGSDEMELDENDPVAVAMAYMNKMSDDQVVQYLGTYNEERKLPNVEFDSDDFLLWLAKKLKSSNVVPSPAPATQGKVCSQMPATTASGVGTRKEGDGAGSGTDHDDQM